jgi:Mg/Co/Ni transporter MgtE
MNKRQLRKVFPLLRILQQLGEVERQIVLCYLTSEGCEGIYECIDNALYNSTLSKVDRQKIVEVLRKNKNKYRCLVRKDVDKGRRHRTLCKVGDGVGIILSIVLPLIEEYLKKK